MLPFPAIVLVGVPPFGVEASESSNTLFNGGFQIPERRAANSPKEGELYGRRPERVPEYFVKLLADFLQKVIPVFLAGRRDAAMDLMK